MSRCGHMNRALSIVLAVVLLSWPAVAVAQAPEALIQLEQQTTVIADKCLAATVGIMMPGGGMGSGVIVSEDGLVMTAAHVLPEVGGDITVVLADGRRVPATALGANRGVDSGLAQITEEGTYPYVEMAASGTVMEGQWCIAFGNSAGIQTDRHAPLRLGRILLVSPRSDMGGGITTDCTVVSGDSGGPLFNLDAEVIGIHSNIEMNVLINRHVPIDVYHSQWDLLMEPNEINVAPQAAGEVIDGLDWLPEHIQRELSRRYDAGEEAVVTMLDEKRGENGKIDLSAEDVAVLLGREDLLDQIRAYDAALRERTSNNSDNEASVLEGDASAAVDARLRETGTFLHEAIRERALFDIADDLQATHGKIAPHVVGLFDEVVAQAGPCTVEIQCQRQRAALGTVVRADGYIVTKASELNGPVSVIVEGEAYLARVVGGDWTQDLALLKINREGLTPVQWADATPPLGSLLVAPGPAGSPIALGAVGVSSRPIPENVQIMPEREPDLTPRPFLGVAGVENEAGVEVQRIVPGTPAEQAGLTVGDIIASIGEDVTTNPSQLIEAINKHAAGDTVTLHLLRDGEAVELEVVLGNRAELEAQTPEQQGESAAEQFSRRAGKLSDRRTRFPAAFQHDTIIWAPDIGGPILNLEGKAVGLNIARYGRTATYAIPVEDARSAVEQMLAGR